VKESHTTKSFLAELFIMEEEEIEQRTFEFMEILPVLKAQSIL